MKRSDFNGSERVVKDTVTLRMRSGDRNNPSNLNNGVFIKEVLSRERRLNPK